MSLLARKASKAAKKGVAIVFVMGVLTFFMYIGVSVVAFLLLDFKPTFTNGVITGVIAFILTLIWIGKNEYGDRKEHARNVERHERTVAAIEEAQANVDLKKKPVAEVMTVTSKFLDKTKTGEAQYVTVLENKSANKTIEYREQPNSKVVYYTVERGKEYAISVEEGLITKIGDHKID